MSPSTILFLAAIVLVIAAHVSVSIRNRRVLHIVSGRPFTPEIPTSDRSAEPSSDYGMIITMVVVILLVSVLIGGTGGLLWVTISLGIVFGVPLLVTVSLMSAFHLIDCVDDFTRFSAKAMGWATFLCAVALLLLD